MAEEDKEEDKDDKKEEFQRGHMMLMMADRCLIFCHLSLSGIDIKILSARLFLLATEDKYVHST